MLINNNNTKNKANIHLAVTRAIKKVKNNYVIHYNGVLMILMDVLFVIQP